MIILDSLTISGIAISLILAVGVVMAANIKPNK